MAIGGIGGSADCSSTHFSRSAQIAGQAALTPAQQQQVQKLRQIDQKVRAHEAAHMAAGAGLTGGASLEFTRGPDGRQYAVAGEVKIDVSPAQTPEQTLDKAKRIQAAALAPADPSSQDRAVAAQAAQLALQAQAEISRTRREEGAAPVAEAQPASNVAAQDAANVGEDSNAAISAVGDASSGKGQQAIAAYSNLEPQPESILSLFA